MALAPQSEGKKLSYFHVKPRSKKNVIFLATRAFSTMLVELYDDLMTGYYTVTRDEATYNPLKQT
jgi:hypothetical protein